jgi:hypothetical protein
MTTVIDHVEGHYETKSMSYGRAYIWCPECVVVECDCGEILILTASESVCWCGTDHEALVRETTAFGRGTPPVGPGVSGVAREARRIPAFGETLSTGIESH